MPKINQVKTYAEFLKDQKKPGEMNAYVSARNFKVKKIFIKKF